MQKQNNLQNTSDEITQGIKNHCPGATDKIQIHQSAKNDPFPSVTITF